MMFFLAQGYRVIAHDRRGHGRSSQTVTGNEMDTYASDVSLAQEVDVSVPVNTLITNALSPYVNGRAEA